MAKLDRNQAAYDLLKSLLFVLERIITTGNKLGLACTFSRCAHCVMMFSMKVHHRIFAKLVYGENETVYIALLQSYRMLNKALLVGEFLSKLFSSKLQSLNHHTIKLGFNISSISSLPCKLPVNLKPGRQQTCSELRRAPVLLVR